jgi:radical SAM superfamily enzyme YgiQ (UPF0313 family)
MGLMYIASSIQKETNAEIKILDLAKHRRLPRLEDDLIGITCTTPHFNKVARMTEDTESPVVLGGPHPTALPWESLYKTEAWGVVRGYAERIMPNIVREFEKKKFCVDKWWSSDFFKDVRPDQPLDDICPMPAYELLDLTEYNPEMSGGPAMTIYTSRGCPYECKFCTTKLYCRRKVWYFSSQRVIDEMLTLRNMYGFENFIIGDDNFLSKKSRVYEICKMIEGYNFKFRCIGRANHIDEDVVKWLIEGGCTEISFGVESGSAKLLRAMGKRLSPERAARAFKLCKDEGLVTKAFFISGFPGETDATVKQTCKWFDEVRPDKWLLSQFVPYPGTEVFNFPEWFGITHISKEWDDYYTAGKGGKGGIVYETTNADTDDLQRFHDTMYDHFQSEVPMER